MAGSFHAVRQAAIKNEEVRQTGRKLKRLIETEERLVSRIIQLQEELKIVRESRKKEEELEMVKTLRSLKLGGRDLFNLLEGIQDGSVSLEKRDLPETDVQDGQESGEQAVAEEKKEAGNEEQAERKEQNENEE